GDSSREVEPGELPLRGFGNKDVLADGHAVRCRLDVRETEAVRLYCKRRFRLSALRRVELRQFRDPRNWRIRQRNRNLDQYHVYPWDVGLHLGRRGHP